MVRINGQDCEKTGISVSDYLEQENYNVKHIVVEYNLEIIPKERYAQTILKDGDEVEIVSFMGGGQKAYKKAVMHFYEMIANVFMSKVYGFTK